MAARLRQAAQRALLHEAEGWLVDLDRCGAEAERESRRTDRGGTERAGVQTRLSAEVACRAVIAVAARAFSMKRNGVS